MNKKLFSPFTFLLFAICSYAQCPNDNTFYLNINPPLGATITENCVYSGEYVTVDVVAGDFYKFSLCENSINFSNSDDTVLTLYTSLGTLLSSNDDFCNTFSEISWVSNLTGTVKLLVDDFTCIDNTNCNILKVTHLGTDTTNCQLNYPIICDALDFNISNTGQNALTVFPNNKYNCLINTPNANWFYLRIANGGNLSFNLTGVSDFDFILYGPFSDLNAANSACSFYGNGGNSGNVVDCGYTNSAVENVDIVGTIPDQVYVLLLTNYSGATQSIDVSAPSGGGTLSCLPLEIESYENNLISIYPNPFQNTFEMKLDSDATITIYDFTGKKLLTKKYFAENSKVDLAELENGNYIMHVLTTDGRTKISKIIKQ